MHLLFLDESGTPPKPNRAQGRYFVIAGLIIPEGAWHGVAKGFGQLRKLYRVTGEIKWRYFGPDNTDEDNSLRHLNEHERNALRRGLYRAITSRKALKIIAAVTCCEVAYQRPGIVSPDDIYHLTYKSVTERFQYFLQDVSRDMGAPQYGMVISDHRMNLDDDKLRKHHHELLDGRGPHSSNYANLIESIHFAPSHFSPGLQLADLVAGGVLRAFQRQDPTFADLVYPSFRTNPKDAAVIEGFGLVKVPRNGFKEPT